MADIAQVVVNNTEYNVADDTKVPYDLLQDTVGFTSKNFFDESLIQVGIAWNGNTNADRARAIIPCQPSTKYILTMNGTNNLDSLGFILPSGSYTTITFPQTITTGANDSIITFGFNKTAIALANVTALKLMLSKADVMDSTYEQYRKPVPQYIEDRIKDTVGWSSKNICKVFNGYSLAGNNQENFRITPNMSNGCVGIAKLNVGTNYIAIKNNVGNRFRIILCSSMPLLTNTRFPGNEIYNDANATEYTFNSGNYNYVVFVCANEAESHGTIYPMISKVDDLSPAYEPYNPSIKQVLKDNKIVEGKNLIPFPYKDGYSVTKLGVTFTVNSDRSITVTGSYTGTGTGVAFDLTDFIYQFVPEGTYILTDGIGARPTAADSSWYVYATKRKGASGTDNYQSVDKTTGKAIITVNYSQYDYLRISLFVQKYANLGSGVIFYPMFYKDTETDFAYEQYYIPGVVSQEAQNILGAKNLLGFESNKTVQDNGVTFNYDVNTGCVTINGTNTNPSSGAWGSCNLKYLPKGRYKLTGLIKGDSVVNQIQFNSTDGTFGEHDVLSDGTDNFGGSFEITDDTKTYRISVRVEKSATANNIKIYPMLRLADVKDDTYVSYAKTNRELTEIVQDLLARVEALES